MKNLSLLSLMVLLAPTYLSAADNSSDTSSPVTVHSTPSPKVIQRQLDMAEGRYKALKNAAKEDYSSLTFAGTCAIKKVIKSNKKHLSQSSVSQTGEKRDIPLEIKLQRQLDNYAKLSGTINGVCAMIPNSKKQIDVCNFDKFKI